MEPGEAGTLTAKKTTAPRGETPGTTRTATAGPGGGGPPGDRGTSFKDYQKEKDKKGWEGEI